MPVLFVSAYPSELLERSNHHTTPFKRRRPCLPRIEFQRRAFSRHRMNHFPHKSAFHRNRPRLGFSVDKGHKPMIPSEDMVAA